MSPARIKLLGLTCESIAEAQIQLNPDANNGMIITKLLANNKKLNEAWLRGRFLRNVRGLAATGTEKTVAAERLGLDGQGALENLLSSDIEAADTWQQAKDDAFIKLRFSFMKSAMDGNQAAIKAMSDILKAEHIKEQAGINLKKLPLKIMLEVLGKHKSTLHYWRVSCGMPVNEDGTYDLAMFLAWYRRFFEGKGTKQKPAEETELDPLKAAKAKRLQMEIDKQRGQLLDRDEVVGGIIARHQILLTWAKHNPDALGRLCQGQKASRITELIKKAIDNLLKDLCNIPPELQLPPATEKKLTKILKELK